MAVDIEQPALFSNLTKFLGLSSAEFDQDR